MRTPSLFALSSRFDGADYDPARDHDRLTKQLGRVYSFMLDGQWRTLRDISEATGVPEASASAQLRHLRKPRFGGYTIDRQRKGLDRGTYEYRIRPRLGSPV